MEEREREIENAVNKGYQLVINLAHTHTHTHESMCGGNWNKQLIIDNGVNYGYRSILSR